MATFTSSSIPQNPTLRSAALNTVVVIPLLIDPKQRSINNDTSHSMQSFRSLFSSLADINLERELALKTTTSNVNTKEVTLTIPNANLTPPGEWRYDDTPLMSHDWSAGCQRMFFVDGMCSIHAHDRLKAFSSKDQSKSSHFGEFVDLYPSRGISAVIGVLSVKDCKSIIDLHRAEEELKMWMQKLTPVLYAQKYWDEAFDSPIAPKSFIDKRLFVFDSFDEGNQIDLSKAMAKPGELVAFPPTQNMDLHLNVVVNDLAVAIFMNLERRIRTIDSLSNESSNKNSSKSGPGIGEVATINTALDVITNDDESDTNSVNTTTSESNSKTPKDNTKGGGNIINLTGLRGLAKALNQRNVPVNDVYAKLPPIEHELQTPIDTSFDEAKLTAKDIESIFRRNAARRQKLAADLALLAGSPMDAYDRYTKAAEASKSAHDPLWYAAALEGIATSFVAMSDTGGHGADFYLENNFQFPDEIMSASLSIIGNTEEGKDSTRIDRSKTTMPRAIYALLEEAYGVYSCNVKLASIYSELLLKVAWYTAELEGLHLRCRWGDGFSGGNDQDDADGHAMTAAISGSQKRWEMTSVSKIDLSKLMDRGKLDPTLNQNAVLQCQRFTETLHRAAGNGGIDAYTRACIAARCAKLCIKGVRGVYWGSLDTRKQTEKRLTLPRKAAFFTAVAAEAMSQCTVPGAQESASGFWAAASHLYSKNGNKFDEANMYAWASLRLTILNALSLYGGPISSEKALENHLLLLGECTPKAKHAFPTKNDVKSRNYSALPSDMNISEPREKGIGDVDEPLTPQRTITLDTPKVVRVKSAPVRSSFFPQINSQAMIEQSKWVDDDSIPMIMAPLIEPSSRVAIYKSDTGEIKFLKKVAKSYRLLSPLINLKCVTTEMNFEVCIASQKRCIAILSELRKRIPTLSPDRLQNDCGLPKDLSHNDVQRSSTLPLQIISSKIIKSPSHLLLDKLKAAGFTGKGKGSLATFFNPFANKKNESMGKNLITLVAQGEERTIVVEFSNSLAVPLQIPTCQLVFDKSRNVDVEGPPLSFTIPPKAKKYAVHFPFIVESLGLNYENEENAIQAVDATGNEKYDPPLFSFKAEGIRVSIFNRSFFVPFQFDAIAHPKDGSSNQKVHESHQIPNPISTFEPYKKKKNVVTDKQKCVNLEAVPAQPNLLVSFSNSPTPIEDAATVPVHLSDGEIFTIPPFRLENDFGSSGLGSLERLQIVGVGMPGLPEQILFDTDEVAKALEEEEDRFSDEESENDVFDEMMEGDGLPPLKMKCLAEGFSLASINDKSKSLGEGSILSFQVAATHDMGNKIINGGNVRIRFRYHGQSPTEGIEIWRKREIALKIVKVKGPRISSLTFRSDLSWGSAYSDLCHSLASQRSNKNEIDDTKSFANEVAMDDIGEGALSEILIPSANADHVLEKETLLDVTGKGNGVFISKDTIVVLMAVANETNSTIVLSNRAGAVGGFESSPMPTVKVSSGVSVKIPVVIPRIDCLDEKGDVMDIANELIAHTALKWESEVVSNADSMQKGIRQGRVRIPSRCLREMIQEHNSFATRICKPPVDINFGVNGIIGNDSALSVSAGMPLDVSVYARVHEWVSAKTLNSCKATLEFCCAREKSGINSTIFAQENKGAFIWCGQLQKSFRFDSADMTHSARVCFLRPGDYVVSACVKIQRRHNEEVWWAPSFQAVKIS